MQQNVELSNPYLNRRQFGRRETSRTAIATIAGSTPIACMIRNLSEGGALLDFPEGIVPDRPFRLAIDGTPFNLFCEVRHHGAYGVGVRFLNPADGKRLMTALYPEQSAQPINAAPSATRPHEPRTTSASVSNRELRLKVLRTHAEQDNCPKTPGSETAPNRPFTQRLRERIATSFSPFRRTPEKEINPAGPSGMEPEVDPPAASDSQTGATPEPTSPADLPAAQPLLPSCDTDKAASSDGTAHKCGSQT